MYLFSFWKSKHNISTIILLSLTRSEKITKFLLKMTKNQNYGTFNKAQNNIKIIRPNVRITIENQVFSQFELIEEMILRFPTLAQDVFKDFDDKSLKNCLNVSKIWSKFIPNEKFPWERCIQSIRRTYKLGCNEHWNRYVNLLVQNYTPRCQSYKC